MFRRSRFVLCAAVLALPFLVSATPGSANSSMDETEIQGRSTDPIAPPTRLSDIDPSSGSFASFPGATTSSASKQAEFIDAFLTGQSDVITAGDCRYRQAIDLPHRSGGDTSIHGWWLRAGGTCPAESNVDTYLQSYWCDRWGCRWITVDSDSRDVRPGGGRGRRGNARQTCATTNSAGWRGFVDVDLIGQSDPSGYTYSDPRNLSCTPS
ncbi:MAG: hypothetical protein AAGA93_09455 [Actinomycetota bacterium]